MEENKEQFENQEKEPIEQAHEPVMEAETQSTEEPAKEQTQEAEVSVAQPVDAQQIFDADQAQKKAGAVRIQMEL